MCVCVQLIHTASLLHDDVIDKSSTRRGVQTSNAVFGNKIAILGGKTRILTLSLSLSLCLSLCLSLSLSRSLSLSLALSLLFVLSFYVL